MTIEKPKMSLWVRALLGVVGGMFLFVALVAAVKGDWEGMQGGLLLFGFIAYLGFLGWFETRYPMPPRSAGEEHSAGRELKRFEDKYPGWPAKFVRYGMPTLLALIAIFELLGLLQSLGIRW